ncbi:MAG: amidohydrolase family protein, partial [Bacteroidota bacterium]
MHKYIFILCLMGLLIGCSSNETIKADKVIENVHVISMNDEEIQQNRTVFIKDDRIVKITGEEQYESENAEVIDGDERYLMPGLSEMHAHIPSGDADQEYIQDVLFLYLANGITTIRGMLGDPLHLELREKA